MYRYSLDVCDSIEIMKIRAKLTLMEMIVVLGFILALSVIFYLGRGIVQLKDFEIKSQKILASLEQIELHASGLLTTGADIFDLKKDLVAQVTKYNKQLAILKNDKGVSRLPKEMKTQMEKLISEWINLYDLYYLSVFQQIDKVVLTPHIHDFGEIGLLNIREELYKKRLIPDEELNHLYALEGSIYSLNEKTSAFASKGRDYLERLKLNLDDMIRKSTIMAITTGAVSIIVSLLIIILFSRRLGKRISMMHGAIQSVAEGDFSKTLKIRSKDEFEDFAVHYNALKEELWNKLDSVLDFMKEIGGSISIGNMYTLDRILETVIKSAVKNTSADSGAVFMISEEDETLIEKKTSIGYLPPLIPIPESERTSIDKIEDYERQHPLKQGETLIGQAIVNGESLLIRNTMDDESLSDHQDPDSIMFISSLAIVPLVITGRVLGAIVIAKTNPGNNFTDIDFSHLKTFSDYSAMTIDSMFNYQELVDKSELYREIKIAADIQSNLLPVKIPESEVLDIGAFSRGAKGVSGDYYDVFRLSDNKVAILICDVVGKGVPAALLMVMIRTIIRLVSSPRRNVAQILTILNKGITKRVEVDQFATMSMIIFNEETREFEYSNSAHSPLLHFIRRNSRFEEIDAPGLPIGIESSEKYSKKTVKTEPGDIIVLYTDGITEARNSNHEEYSQFSLQRLIKNNSSSTAGKLVDAVKTDLNNFVGLSAQHDDQTILLIKVK